MSFLPVPLPFGGSKRATLIGACLIPYIPFDRLKMLAWVSRKYFPVALKGKDGVNKFQTTALTLNLLRISIESHVDDIVFVAPVRAVGQEIIPGFASDGGEGRSISDCQLIEVP